MSDLEDRLLLHIRAAGLPMPERELMLIPGRKFRCDLAWPAHRLVVEIDGGTFTRGRHSQGMGQATDAEKRNLLVLAGYRVLTVTTLHVRSGAALGWIEQALAAVR
jgi:very-short-patch-repair endonuclease